MNIAPNAVSQDPPRNWRASVLAWYGLKISLGICEMLVLVGFLGWAGRE